MGRSWKIASAAAYGGVLLSRKGHVLLREPTNHFDGYVWTYAKGRPDKGESPEQTALREVWEETGCRGRIIGALPGTYASGLSCNAYFVLSLEEQSPAFGWETQTVHWADFAEARRMIEQTTNLKGRHRDLQVLEAAEAWFRERPSLSLPDYKRQITRRATTLDWRIQPFSDGSVTVPLDMTFSASQALLLKMGFIPDEMEQKWFAYFHGNVLYQHRSWTGHGVDRIYFEPCGEGLKAIRAEVNSEAGQWMDADYAWSARRIESMLRELADPDTHQPTPFPLLTEIEQQPSSPDKPSRLSPFTFDAVGIEPGCVLHFKLSPDLVCVVEDSKRVFFQGDVMSLSRAALAAMLLVGKPRKAARGPDYWLYEGMTLTERRQWLATS